MVIECPSCGEEMETIDNLEVGQHVVCPHCGVKFSYGDESVEDVSEMESKRNDRSPQPFWEWAGDFYRRHKKVINITAAILSLVVFIVLLFDCSIAYGCRRKDVPALRATCPWFRG